MKTVKKLVTLILALLLVTVPALAAQDYSSFSDDDLWAEMKAIQAELWARSIAKDGVTVNSGTYKIGEDIPSGNYRIAMKEGTVSALISVDSAMYIIDDSTPEIGKLVLENDSTLKIIGTVIIYAYTGLFN